MYSVDLSLTNGLGKPAVSIYYSGCDIPVKCRECHNSELWNKQDTKIEYDELIRIIKEFNTFHYSDELIVSFLGGEPFAPYNRNSVIEVSKRLKEDFPKVKTIVYSWRLPEQVEDEWIENIDLGVLGQFDIRELREDYLPASSNQVIYDFNKKEVMPAIKIK